MFLNEIVSDMKIAQWLLLLDIILLKKCDDNAVSLFCYAQKPLGAH